MCLPSAPRTNSAGTVPSGIWNNWILLFLDLFFSNYSLISPTLGLKQEWESIQTLPSTFFLCMVNNRLPWRSDVYLVTWSHITDNICSQAFPRAGCVLVPPLVLQLCQAPLHSSQQWYSASSSGWTPKRVKVALPPKMKLEYPVGVQESL